MCASSSKTQLKTLKNEIKMNMNYNFCLWEQGAAGSNPVAPTRNFRHLPASGECLIFWAHGFGHRTQFRQGLHGGPFLPVHIDCGEATHRHASKLPANASFFLGRKSGNRAVAPSPVLSHTPIPSISTPQKFLDKLLER